MLYIFISVRCCEIVMYIYSFVLNQKHRNASNNHKDMLSCSWVFLMVSLYGEKVLHVHRNKIPHETS
jgi:hypothetical protein